ncbi:MAG: Holliday junction resolvase RecU [Bacillota bacterium]
MSQGNRGMAFEMMLNLINQMYAKQKVALINKRPTPVKVLKSKGTKVISGFYETQSTVDYDGVYRGHAIAFEAKSVGIDRFDLKNLHQHQFDYLEKVENMGGISFVLIEFRTTKQIFFVPFSTIKHYFYHSSVGGRKSIPLVDLEIYAYEVKRTKRSTLDYLEWVDKLIGDEVAV